MSSHEPKLLRGKKLSNTHTTTIPLVRKVIRKLKPLEAVDKIVLGPVKRLRAAPRWIKLSIDPKSGQARIQCRDSHDMQRLWCLGEIEAIEAALRKIPGIRFVRA